MQIGRLKFSSPLCSHENLGCFLEYSICPTRSSCEEPSNPPRSTRNYNPRKSQLHHQRNEKLFIFVEGREKVHEGEQVNNWSSRPGRPIHLSSPFPISSLDFFFILYVCKHTHRGREPDCRLPPTTTHKGNQKNSTRFLLTHPKISLAPSRGEDDGAIE